MSWLEVLRGWLGAFSLDLKRGGRMLVKYPGLTFRRLSQAVTR